LTPFPCLYSQDPHCLHFTDFYLSLYNAFKECNVNQCSYMDFLIGAKGKNKREVESLWHVKTAVLTSNNIK